MGPAYSLSHEGVMSRYEVLKAFFDFVKAQHEPSWVERVQTLSEKKGLTKDEARRALKAEEQLALAEIAAGVFPGKDAALANDFSSLARHAREAELRDERAWLDACAKIHESLEKLEAEWAS